MSGTLSWSSMRLNYLMETVLCSNNQKDWSMIFQLWVNYVLKRQMPACPRLYMSSMDTLQSAGFLPLKLVFSTVLFGDELDSHCTSTPHCLENRGRARLISVLASGLLSYCECSQPLTCTSEGFSSLLEAILYAVQFIWWNWHSEWHPTHTCINLDLWKWFHGGEWSSKISLWYCDFETDSDYSIRKLTNASCT